jgi:hypothetical protein
MNKYILVILKTMAKNPNIRKTETWTESKTQIVSILTRKIQKLKVDHHFMNMDVNELHMGIHSKLSFQQNIFPDKYDGLYYLLLE